MKLTLILLELFSVLNLIIANTVEQPKGTKTTKTGFRAGRASLVTFEPFGKQVNVGLDILMPFVKVPTKRKLDENGKENALLTVNTAAVTIAGLISGMGLFLGHILKSITTLQGRENIEENTGKETDDESRESGESGESHTAEHRLDYGVEGYRFSRSLEPFKFVYRNSSGGRVDTTLDALLNTIEHTLLDDHVDLNACIQKAICALIKRSSLNVVKGDASALESIVDGISQLDWLLNFMRETAIEEAILAGKSKLRDQCAEKYPNCYWNNPDQKLFHLISKRVRFI